MSNLDTTKELFKILKLMQVFSGSQHSEDALNIMTYSSRHSISKILLRQLIIFLGSLVVGKADSNSKWSLLKNTWWEL